VPLIVHPSSPPPTLTPQEEQRRTVRGYILFFFAMVILLGVLWVLRNVLEIVYVSALFAVVLMPIVQQIRKMRIFGWQPSRTAAVLGLVITVFLVLALFFIIAMPPVLHDIEHFSADLPRRLPAIGAKLKRLPLADRFGVDSVGEKIQNLLASTASYLFASAPKWVARVMDVVTAGILCIYFMLEGDFAYFYFLSFIPLEYRDRLARTLVAAEGRMSKWLIGQAGLMVILGITSTVVFNALHVRYAVLLGVLMGLFNIVPVIGGVVTILLAASVAAMDSWSKMAGVFIFYAIYIQIESAFLTPRIMRTSVNLMGLSVLIALLAGTELAGIVGALVAVPSAALFAVIMDEYVVQKDADASAKVATANVSTCES
jgi:predicted PurR-regulated permease PerM